MVQPKQEVVVSLPWRRGRHKRVFTEQLLSFYFNLVLILVSYSQYPSRGRQTVGKKAILTFQVYPALSVDQIKSLVNLVGVR